MTWQRAYTDRFYNRQRGWTDGTTDFWSLCAKEIQKGSRILELGSGPSNPTSCFLASLGDLDGADVDPEVKGNHHLRRASIIGSDGRLPVRDESYDACVSNYVAEHLSDPRSHLVEVRRALRPGGAYVFRTPNLLHYVSMFAALTPRWVHAGLANRLRKLGPEAHEPYPTFHRLNTRQAIGTHAKAAGLEVAQVSLIEKEPSYGMSSRVLFLAFLAYERIVNSTELLAGVRANFLVVLRKPLV